MNWDAIGAIGETVGALAVILTLAYLAVQIRQNALATQTASHHAVTDSLNQGNLAMAQDAALALCSTLLLKVRASETCCEQRSRVFLT
jgi:hypothetical protein